MTYPPADTKAQWFQDDYPGAPMDPNVGVLHTTEGTDWPPYGGGASAPNYTAKPIFEPKGRYLRLEWRAHFPDNRSSRALRNEPGGVETNTLNALQVELIGTCDPAARDRWRRAGVDFIYWPEAPEAALEDLAEFIAWCERVHGIPVRGPVDWLAYGPDPRRPGITPASYGNHPYRFTGTRWRKFTGWCGHQHVPENSHGDPGNIKWETIALMAAPVDEWDGPPLVLDVSVIQAAFRAHVKGESQPRWSRTAVRRLQRALNHVYGAGLSADGRLTRATVAAWRAHETEHGGRGRPEVPDLQSLRALAEPRFVVIEK